MAAALYTTDLTDVYTDTSGGAAVLISSGGGGQNAITDPETDDYIQGASSISRNPWSGSIRGIVYSAPAAQSVAVGDAIFIWTKADVSQALNTKALGGVQILVGNTSAALKAYYADGNDSYTFGGWKCYPIDPTITPDTTIGTPSAVTQSFGVRWDVPGAGPSKGFPFKIDAIRRGRTIIATQGDLINGYATFLAAAVFQGAIVRQWGLFQAQNGTYLQQGLFRQGTSAIAVDFRDSNRVIFIAATDFVGSNFNGYEINNAASNILWNNISISSLGIVSRGNFVINNNPIVLWDTCTFTDVGTFVLGGANTTVTQSTFRRTDSITLNSASFTNNVVTNNRAASSILASSLNGITNCNFISDGSNHAVEINSLGNGSMSWGNTSSGYAAANGVTGNESIFVNVASGILTINVQPGATPPSIRTAGAVVTVIAGAVDYTLTIRDTGSNLLQNARVFLVAEAGGPLPYRAAVSITRSGTTATVTHTVHGLSNGDKVVIKGVDQREYYGIHTISGVTTNSYQFTVAGSPATPATGTILSTSVLISQLTGADGKASGTRTFASNQPVGGSVRKASSAPFFKTGTIVGTINNSTGLNLTITLLSDQ
jgi:hypothetical protein